MKKAIFLVALLVGIIVFLVFMNEPPTSIPKEANANPSVGTEKEIPLSEKIMTEEKEDRPKTLPDSTEEKEEKEELPVLEEIKEVGTYKKLRYYDSDVHIYISGKGETLAVSKGKDGLEPLKNITLPNEVAKINLGMFDSWFEHGGMYLIEGEYLQPPHKRYIDLHYYKDGRIDIANYDENFAKSQLDVLKKETHFVIGTTYSLIQDGVKNLQNADLYSHANSRQPRTLFGQRADGRFVMVVVDGRKHSSKGVSAEQSAAIMLDLGCVEAVNMDGGGSSSIRVNGELKNAPSEGRERMIGSALLIIH